MFELLLGIVLASSFLLLALSITKAHRGLGDYWLIGWLVMSFLLSISFLGGLFLKGFAAGLSLMIATSLVSLSGPLLYFFAKAEAGETVPFRALHFLPFIAYNGFGLWLLNLGIVRPVSAVLMVELDVSSQFLVYLPPLALSFILIYPALSMRAIVRRREKLKQELSDLDDASLTWVNVWAVSTIALVAVQLIASLGVNFFSISIEIYKIVILGASGLQILYVGFHGLRHTQIFGLLQLEKPTLSDGKVSRNVDPEDMAAIDAFMESRQPFLEAGIPIQEFANKLGWGLERVSQTLRFGFHETYFDYINRHRIEEVKRQMKRPQNEKVTLLSLALDAGFGSKSSFNSSFVKYMGQTPSQFRRRE